MWMRKGEVKRNEQKERKKEWMKEWKKFVERKWLYVYNI